MEQDDQLHSMMKDIEELIICPRCLRRYNNPKILPCGHSFCRECLKKVPIPNDGQNCRTCTDIGCRQKFILSEHDVGKLPNSSVIDNLIQICQKNEEEIKQCSSHRHKRSVTFCIECNKYMCKNCTEMHHKFEMMAKHTVLPVDKTKNARIKEVLDSSERNNRCQTHADIVTSYCKTCKETYCVKCKYHASHDTETISTFVRSVRKHLQQCIADQGSAVSQLSERISNYNRFHMELVTQLESSREKLYAFSKYLQDCIGQKAKALNEELTQLITAKTRDFSVIIKQLEDEQAVRKRLMNDMLATLNYGSNVQQVRTISGFHKRYVDISAFPQPWNDQVKKVQFNFKPSTDTGPIKEFVLGSISERQTVCKDQTMNMNMTPKHTISRPWGSYSSKLR